MTIQFGVLSPLDIAKKINIEPNLRSHTIELDIENILKLINIILLSKRPNLVFFLMTHTV